MPHQTKQPTSYVLQLARTLKNNHVFDVYDLGREQNQELYYTLSGPPSIKHVFGLSVKTEKTSLRTSDILT